MPYRNNNSLKPVRSRPFGHRPGYSGLLFLGLFFSVAFAPVASGLESDRQQPLQVDASSTDGTLGDGKTVLSGQVEIRQGTLHIKADEATVEKANGKVRTITFRGRPAWLEQEIEEQGLIQAQATTITYQVGPGMVVLQGAADVTHPQYQISGDELTYDLNKQHFEGSGSDGADGRISIRLDPEVASDITPQGTETGEESPSAAADDATASPEGEDDA